MKAGVGPHFLCDVVGLSWLALRNIFNGSDRGTGSDGDLMGLSYTLYISASVQDAASSGAAGGNPRPSREEETQTEMPTVTEQQTHAIDPQRSAPCQSQTHDVIEPSADTGQWLRLYDSEVNLSGAAQGAVEWHPLPDSLCPLGRPNIRRNEVIMIEIYEYSIPRGNHESVSAIQRGSHHNRLKMDRSLIGSWEVDLALGCASYRGGVFSNNDMILYVEYKDGSKVCVNQQFMDSNAGEQWEGTQTTPTSHSKTDPWSLLKAFKEQNEVSDSERSSLHLDDNDITRRCSTASRYQLSNKRSLMSRPVYVHDIERHIHKILKLQRRWQETYDIKDKLYVCCEQKQAVLDPIQEKRRELDDARGQLKTITETKRRLESKIQTVREEYGRREKQCKVQSQALVSTLQALAQAAVKVQVGKDSLEGEDGIGRVTGLLRQLISRRHTMVVEAGRIYRLGPRQVRSTNRWQPGNLDAQIDIGWTGTADTNQAWPSNDADQSIHEMKLTLNGMGLNPSVWKHAFSPEGYQWDAASDKSASVVLGYAAHLTERISEYLGIPLRYPITFCGSQSAVYDGYTSTGSSSSHLSDSPKPPAAYPLYCTSNRDRPRFAIAVFLLNKNVIQLLQAHGMSSFGPNQLLQNLYALLSCATSSISHGWKCPSWATAAVPQ